MNSGWVRFLLLVGILFLAGVVQHTAPSDAEWQSPMPVRGHPGDVLVGRNIQATVVGASLAHAVSTKQGWAGETTGVWVLVEVQAEAVVDEFGARLGLGRLRIGDTTFSASTRAGLDSMQGAPLSVGIPTQGLLVFEVPQRIVEGPDAAIAQVELAISDDPRLDSLLLIPLDLGQVTLEKTLIVDAPEWGAR